MRKEIRSMKNLIEENKKELLNDKKAMEKIEKRLEERYEMKRLA